MSQTDLFGRAAALPSGFEYRTAFLSREMESGLLEIIARLPLAPAEYRQYTARRRIVSYGRSYDFTHNRLLPADPIPEFLFPLRHQIAEWVSVPEKAFEHALVTEYAPGTPLGWHRDAPGFDLVVGVSLASEARMRFRPYPPPAAGTARRKSILTLDLEPRSAYILRGPARWQWQHSIAPTKTLRYSITMRTLRSTAKPPT